MANNKWVEVEAKSIDDAIKAGLKELNLQDATQANINICLLYTSPSPRDQRGSRMPSCG
mgnify:CR=1 FL=1